jgi:hypothetical protein
VHQARCDGARLIGLFRKPAAAAEWLEAAEAVAAEAAVAAMQAFSAEQPLPQQPVPVFSGYNTRGARPGGGRSREQMQESARQHLNEGRLPEQRAVKVWAGRSPKQRAAILKKAWATRRAAAAAAAAAAQAGGDPS